MKSLGKIIEHILPDKAYDHKSWAEIKKNMTQLRGQLREPKEALLHTNLKQNVKTKQYLKRGTVHVNECRRWGRLQTKEKGSRII